MTREQCERHMLIILREIVDTYHEYYPAGDYLILEYHRNIDEEREKVTESFNVHNAHWKGTQRDAPGKDKDRPICLTEKDIVHT